MNVKKQHILTKGAEFSFLILFLAVPPLLPQGDVTAGQSPGIHVTLPGIAVTAAVSAGLLLLCGTYPFRRNLTRRVIMKEILLSLLTLGGLIITMLIIGYVLPFHRIHPQPSITVIAGNPVFFAAGTLISACYEEILYRWYLPLTGGALLTGMFNPGGETQSRMGNRTAKRFRQVIPETAAELLPLLLFAPAHGYLGIAAVVNACIAGILLRNLVMKTATPFTAAAVHWIYNMLVYIALHIY